MGSDSKIRIFSTQKSDTWSNQMTGEKWSIAIQMYDLCRFYKKRDIFYCLVFEKTIKTLP